MNVRLVQLLVGPAEPRGQVERRGLIGSSLYSTLGRTYCAAAFRVMNPKPKIPKVWRILPRYDNEDTTLHLLFGRFRRVNAVGWIWGFAMVLQHSISVVYKLTRGMRT